MGDGGDVDLFSWQKRKQAVSKGSAATTAVTEAPAPEIFTVTQVNTRAKNLLERQFARVMVVGEISNYKAAANGHRYFSLKDASSQLNAVLFRREANHVKFDLKDGLEVVVTGRLTVFSRASKYQIVAERVEQRGAGALQAAFEELKRRLKDEGLFDLGRKRPLPLIPQCVAVITSPSGAVIHDIVQVATRRLPKTRILLVPCGVQGAQAAGSIASAIRRVARIAEQYDIDVAIIARGGGSLEDLWGYNEESVARAIAESPVVVVSAVGHEADFTIADLVADHRAATPSAAGELIFPVASELSADLARQVHRATRATRRAIEQRRHRLGATRARLGDGRSLTRDYAQRLTDLHQLLEHHLRGRITKRRLALQVQQNRLVGLHPRVRLSKLQARVCSGRERLVLIMGNTQRQHRDHLEATHQQLVALSPKRVMERGYAIVLGADGKAITEGRSVRVGDVLDVRLAHGRLGAKVESVDEA